MHFVLLFNGSVIDILLIYYVAPVVYFVPTMICSKRKLLNSITLIGGYLKKNTYLYVYIYIF